MPVFRAIEFWPSSGREDEPWTDDPATDSLVKSAVRVSEAYGEALRAEQLVAPRRSLRLFPHPNDADAVVLQVDTGSPGDGGSGLVLVPKSAAELSADDRALLVLDVIDDVVTQLAPHRGWPWKSSPDRSMSARISFWIADDGLGRATLEVKDRKSADLVARSMPVTAYGSLDGAKSSAKTLRWVKRRIEFIPRPGQPAGGDMVSMDPDLGEIHPDQPKDRGYGRPPGLTNPAVVREEYGSQRVAETPGIQLFLGFGIDLRAAMLHKIEAPGTGLEESIERELFDRIGSGEAGIRDWPEGLPVEIVLEYHLPARLEGFGEYGIRLRRTTKRLSVVVLRDGAWIARSDLGGSDVHEESALVAAAVMDAISARALTSKP